MERLALCGDRMPKWAIQVIAISQLRHDTIGREVRDRKIDDGETSREALRALKRRLSNVVYRYLGTAARPLDLPRQGPPLRDSPTHGTFPGPSTDERITTCAATPPTR